MKDVSVSCAIMAHPRRAAHAEALRARHPELDARVVFDPDPHGSPSALRTAALAWQAAPATRTHHLVLQDDAVPCDGFPGQLRAAVRARPADALSFFTEWGSRISYMVRLAALCGASWAPAIGNYVPSVALLLPSALARELGAYLRDGCAPSEADDAAIYRFLRTHGVDAFVSVPNLVDHQELGSLVGNESLGPRPSVWFDPAPGPAGRWSAAPADFAFSPYPNRSRYGGGIDCLVRGEPGEFERSRVPAAAILRQRRVSETELRDSLGDVVAGMADDRRRAIAGLDQAAVRDVWLVSWLLGLSLADHPGQPRAAWAQTAVKRPTGWEALASLPGGMLRDRLPAADLDRCRPALTQLVRHGLARSVARARGAADTARIGSAR